LHITAAGRNNIFTKCRKDLEVDADAERIQRVIVNNAVKHAPQSKYIFITVEKAPDKVKVLVIDKGLGIPKEKSPNLFDRFYRTQDNGGQHSGFGLGLYISAEVIRNHGGQIGVDSEPGKGSTFWFTLPQ
jgi:signal transduction histidine kinase